MAILGEKRVGEEAASLKDAKYLVDMVAVKSSSYPPCRCFWCRGRDVIKSKMVKLKKEALVCRKVAMKQRKGKEEDKTTNVRFLSVSSRGFVGRTCSLWVARRERRKDGRRLWLAVKW